MSFTLVCFVSACTNNEPTNVEPTVSPTQSSKPTESVEPTETNYESLKYQSKEGWSILYPMMWDYTSDDTLKESSTDKYISFDTHDIPEDGVEKWLDSKIEQSLALEEADNTLLEEVTKETKDGLTVYKYAIQSNYLSQITKIRFVIYVDHDHIYMFHGQVPPLTKDEFEEIVGTFSVGK
jgi:hypothetical protein